MSYTWWHERKEDLPEDGVVCVFHRKRTKADNLKFGWYGFECFVEGNVRYPKTQIDYWMPIPVLPEKERK